MAIDIKRFLKGLGVLNATDSTKQLNLSVDNSATTNTTTTLVSAQTANRTVILPDNSGTLSTVNGSEALTNKTIDADLNTITNIDNNEIKANAAIDATKIANGSVSNTEFQYLDGVNAPIQSQIDSIASGTGTASNLGTGEGVFAQKVVSDFQFKSLKSSGNVTVTSDANEITIGAVIPASANPSLSNLTNPTSINQDLIGNKGTTFNLKTQNETTVASKDLRISSGQVSGNFASGVVTMASGDVSGTANSGAVFIQSGSSGSQNSGNVTIGSGTASSGTAGEVALVGGPGAGGVRGDISLIGNSINLLPTTSVDFNNTKAINVADPTSAQDAATKAYVDAGNPIIIKRILSANQTLNNGTPAVLFNTTDINTSGVAQPIGSGIIVPSTGYYSVDINIYVSNTAAFYTTFNVVTNLANPQFAFGLAQSNQGLFDDNYSISEIRLLTAGDTLNVFYTDSTTTSQASAASSYFSITKLK